MRLPRLSAFTAWKVSLPTVRGRQVTWPIVGAVVGAALLLGLGTAWAFSGRAPSSVTAEPTATPTARPTIAASTSAPTPTSAPTATAASGIRPGEIIATVTGDSLGIYAEPGDPKPASTLSKWSTFFSPRTLLAVDATGIGDEEWLKVDLPIKPNGQTGWIRASDVKTSSTDLSIHIFLDERQLELWRGDEVILSTPVVVGKDSTPTPTGLFYVTDPLDFSANPRGVYGSYALGLSGYSDTLSSFNGGPPQIAIHGTNEPQLLGTAASHGCVRLPNDKELALARTVPLGTPVFIVKSRDNAA